jgi:eukaryotic-like serine/threonine-protein kinase
LWETLTGQRLFRGETEAQVLHLVMTMDAPKPSSLNPEVPAALDEVTLKGLARDPANRYATAREMAAAIEACVPIASAMKVAEWLGALIGPTLAARDAIRADIESGASSTVPPTSFSSTPALPAFPQVAGGSSSASMSHPGVAESTASLVIGGTAIPPTRSRWPIVAVAVGVVGILVVAVAVGIVFGRGTRDAAVTTVPPTPTEPTHVSAVMVAQPPVSSVVTASVVASVSARVTSPKPSATHVHVGSQTKPPGSNTNENDSLLDSR